RTVPLPAPPPPFSFLLPPSSMPKSALEPVSRHGAVPCPLLSTQTPAPQPGPRPFPIARWPDLPFRLPAAQTASRRWSQPRGSTTPASASPPPQDCAGTTARQTLSCPLAAPAPAGPRGSAPSLPPLPPRLRSAVPAPCAGI